jgi:shikimate kinase
MKVFLVGPMGTGKSTTGRNLSEKLDYDFYDTDKLIEKAEGRKIKDIFEQNGEDYFRKKESKALSETKTLQNVVIATGGGIVEREKNRLFLKHEDKVIFLDSSPERQFERTKDSKKRPLLNDGDGLEILKKLYEKRINFYEAISKKTISMDNLNTKEILKKIINFIDE